MTTAIYPWQTTQWHALLTRWHAQNLPHALLLAGPKDSGKLTFAMQLATRLLCQGTPCPDDSACGNCASCQLIAAHTHPDFFLLQPEGDSKIIKIEQVRELLESLQQTALRYQQIVIIEPAEAMNKSAANALLKTLEEPTGQVTFFVISHQPSSVSPTIRSRCQKIDFPVPSKLIALDWLKNRLPSSLQIELLLALCENLPLRALAFVEGEGFKTHQKLFAQFMQLCNRQLTPLEMAQYCVDLPQDQILTGLWCILMDVICIKQHASNDIAHGQQIQALTTIASHTPSSVLFRFIDRLIEIKRLMNAKLNLNMVLLWENFFIDWAQNTNTDSHANRLPLPS